MQTGKLPNSQQDHSGTVSGSPTDSQKRCSICNLPVGAHPVKENGDIVLCDGERIKCDNSN